MDGYISNTPNISGAVNVKMKINSVQSGLIGSVRELLTKADLTWKAKM